MRMQTDQGKEVEIIVLADGTLAMCEPHVHNRIYGVQGHWRCGECDGHVPFGYKGSDEK